jgi:hypothetical protein
MLGTFRKHSKWLWGIIITAMVISLVVWTGNSNNSGNERSSSEHGSIGGKKITGAEFGNAYREARIEHFFQRQSQGLSLEESWSETDSAKQGYSATFEAYRHLFFKHKIKEMGIYVSDEEVQKVAAQNFKSFGGPSGTMTSGIFADQVLARGGVTLADYERFLRGMIGRQQLVSAVTVGGQLVTAKDARAIYEREHQEISAQAAFFSVSNYLGSIAATPAAIAEYYTNQISRYRLPDRVQVSYVAFNVTNFSAEANAEIAKLTNVAAIVESVYQRRGGTNYYKDMTVEKAAESIREEMHQEIALRAARAGAAKFVTPLLEPGVKIEAFVELARKEGHTIKVSSAFDAQNGPAELLSVNELFVRAAFELRDDEPIFGPIVTRDAVYVIAKNKDFPSENPPFELVREKVTSDYKLMNAARAAQVAAQALIQSANGTNGLAQGKPFAALCAEAGAKPLMVPAFSMSTRSIPEIEEFTSIQMFKQVASQTPVKTVSEVRAYAGSGVVHVMSKLPLDEAKAAKELPEFATLLRQARQEEAFRKWFESEAPKVLAETPVVQREAQVGAPGAN